MIPLLSKFGHVNMGPKPENLCMSRFPVEFPQRSNLAQFQRWNWADIKSESSYVLQKFLSMLVKNKFKIEKWRLWWKITNTDIHSKVNSWKVTLYKLNRP